MRRAAAAGAGRRSAGPAPRRGGGGRGGAAAAGVLLLAVGVLLLAAADRRPGGAAGGRLQRAEAVVLDTLHQSEEGVRLGVDQVYDALHGSARECFLAIGDFGMGDGTPAQREVAAAMDRAAAECGAKWVLGLGDNFYEWGVENLQDPLWRSHFFDVYDTGHALQIPWYLALGDHDHCGNVSAEVAQTLESDDIKWNMVSTCCRAARLGWD